jgi:hypothetical protein
MNIKVEILNEGIDREINKAKMKKYLSRFDSAEDFKENGVRAGIGGVKISEILQYIDKNSENYLDKSEIRRELSKAGQYYFLYEINPRKLDIQDEGDLETADYDSESLEKPVVVGKDYFLIDGRHRTLVAIGLGRKKIKAYLPPEILYKELIR